MWDGFSTRPPPEGRPLPRPPTGLEPVPHCIHGKQSRAVAAQLIDGKAVAKVLDEEVAAAIARLGFRPGLVAVRVGNDPASEVYVRNKARKARELGLEGTELVFAESMSEADLLAEVARLNADGAVDGILV